MTSDPLQEFDLPEYVRRQLAVIDGALERFLPDSGESRTILKAMRYGVLSGGKRIRPILTLAAGELFGVPPNNLLPFACAVEMIHAYSLIHDDLPALDNDDLRRGKPTTHRVFGEGMALLAGDALLTEAFRLMTGSEARRSFAAELLLQLIHEISRAAGVTGLVGGQALDLEAEGKDVDLADVEFIHVRKTGALILAAVRIGAQAGGAKPSELGSITRYGERLGLAFQIADDILDARGERPADEAAESSNHESKKATYPALVGLRRAEIKLEELLQSCLAELKPFGAAAAPLAAIANHVVARASGQRKIQNEESGN
jgi:geranylgeranyl diphosphate synthase type II